MPKIKNIIIFTVIAVAFILIYIFFIKPSPNQASLVSSESAATLPNIDGSTTNTSASNSLMTKDFLTLFSNIKNLKLDDAIFSDPAFISLHDSSITLTPDGTEGRPNPFAQFSNDSTAVASPNTANIPNVSNTPPAVIPPVTPPPVPPKITPPKNVTPSIPGGAPGIPPTL